MWALLACLIAGIFLAAGQPPVTNESVRQAYEAGEKSLRDGDLHAAEQSFQLVLRLVPEDVGARVNLGVVFLREKNWSRALQYLREAEKRAPGVTGIRLNIGLAEYRKGDYAAAIPAFESVLRDQPDSLQARHLLGLSYLFEEHYSDAAQTLEPLWPTSNSDVSYLYSVAVAAGNAKRQDLEEKSLARLMEVGGDSPLVHLLHGKAYLAHENFEAALAELQIALREDEKLPLLHYNLGVVYRRQGHLDTARDEFLRDIALEPSVAFDYDQLGAISYTLQQNQKAETYFRDALKRNPNLGTSWFGLAKIYKQEKRYSDALHALSQAGSIDPHSASVHYLRAQVLIDLGRKDDARNEMDAVRRLKQQSLDKLEQEVNQSPYHDPEVTSQSNE